MGLNRPGLTKETKQQIEYNASILQKDENGKVISPNGTGKEIDATAQYGHRNGFENKAFVTYAQKTGMTQGQLNSMVNNAGLFQLEPGEENMSHVYEEKDFEESLKNVNAYAASQDKNLAANTFITMPTENTPGMITTINMQTGEEEELVTFTDKAYVVDINNLDEEIVTFTPSEAIVHESTDASMQIGSHHDIGNSNGEDGNINLDGESNFNNYDNSDDVGSGIEDNGGFDSSDGAGNDGGFGSNDSDGDEM